MVGSLVIQITFSLEIMLTEENNLFNAFVYFLHIRLNIHRTSFYLGGIINALASIEFMDFTTNV